MTETEAIEAMIENEYAKGEEIEAEVRERVDKELSEILDKISADIKSMEYHMIDCDVLVSQEEVLDIIEKYKG